jgi:hypothetical protein
MLALIAAAALAKSILSLRAAQCKQKSAYFLFIFALNFMRT